MRRARKIRMSILGIFVVLALAVWFTPFGGWISGKVIAIAHPVMGNDPAAATLASVQNLTQSKGDLITQNAQLKQTVAELSAELIDRNTLVKENADLRTMLGQHQARDQTVTAQVLAGPGRTPYDTLLLDAGSTSGVKQGDRVLAPGGIAIGEIQDVYQNTAKAILYSSSGQSVDVVINGSNIPVTAEGRGSGNFAIQIPRDTQVAVGDLIYLPDHTDRIVGTVERIEDTPNDPFKTLLFKSPVNIFEIQWVQILKNTTSS